ncbi:MAG TPA: acylphosphatase [Fimbriiglobus sp.]|jgi:acylphosphatase
MAELVGRRVLYTGRVQGVGFRYRAVEIAREFPVVGWVRNLPTGQVELWVEGDEKGVSTFLTAVRECWGTFIRDEQTEQEPATGRFQTFDVTV